MFKWLGKVFPAAVNSDAAEERKTRGNAHFSGGELDSAAACYRQAIELNPDYAEAYNNLGRVFLEQKQYAEAERHLKRAAALNPRLANTHYNLGLIYQSQGRLDEAASCFNKTLALQPDMVEAHNDLGNVLESQGRLEESLACFCSALSLNPNDAGIYNNQGFVYLTQGKFDEALSCFNKALSLKPELAEAHYNMGNLFRLQGKLEESAAGYRKALSLKPDIAGGHNILGLIFHAQGKFEESLDCYRKALALNPDDAAAYNNQGRAWFAQGEYDESLSCYRKALSLNPELAETHNNIGSLFRLQGKLEESAASHRKALSLNPDIAEAHNNLGVVLHAQGKFEESLDCYRKALSLKPDYRDARSNLLLALNYYFDITPEALYEEHLNFGKPCEAQFVNKRLPHANDRDPARKLRIAYISADFRRHSVAYFIEPVLAQHDRRQFEVICYYNKLVTDDVTRRLQGYADTWRNITGESTENVAERIRADRIDILVDLSGHTGDNRLPVFACKPAPVQVTWLGYPNTTGLSTMDYRITDVYAEPEGMTEHLNTEKLYRLPEVFCGYRPKEGCPAPADAAPAFRNGTITFGCFNNFAKVSSPAVELWAKILKAVPDSRLLLESPGLGDAAFRQVVFERFGKYGVKPERLELLERSPANQYKLYHRVDICLDPFPCNGGTTSCDALWMGTPLVTLAGKTFVSRMGVSLLSNVGLAELIAQTPEEYVTIAIKLATDLDYLRKIRHGLRERVAESPLLDMPGFTRQMESAYREMWRRWCLLP